MAESSRLPDHAEANLVLHSVDLRGRAIHPEVLNVAQFMAPRVIAYAESVIRDPALATSLLEEAAACVSRVVWKRSRSHQDPIAHIEGYLFRAFIRRVNLAHHKELLLSGVVTLSGTASGDGFGYSDKLYLKILTEELVTRCDPVTRDMFYRRIQGYSWKDIGKIYGVSAHAAEARFSQNVNKLRRRLGLKKPHDQGSGDKK